MQVGQIFRSKNTIHFVVLTVWFSRNYWVGRKLCKNFIVTSLNYCTIFYKLLWILVCILWVMNSWSNLPCNQCMIWACSNFCDLLVGEKLWNFYYSFCILLVILMKSFVNFGCLISEIMNFDCDYPFLNVYVAGIVLISRNIWFGQKIENFFCRFHIIYISFV